MILQRVTDFPVSTEGAMEGPIHLAMGIFDGVHLGHQSVIETALHAANRLGGVAAALTFDPHPSRLFRPEDPTLMMMPQRMKCEHLLAMGLRFVINQRFDLDFAALTAEAFVAHVKECLPQLKALYVGENFRFGRGRQGDVRVLVDLAKAWGVDVVSANYIRRNGEIISSTRIRGELAQGAMEEVNQLLGYPYYSQSTVVAGKRLGRQLGVPTLNLPWAPEMAPRFGVYAVQVEGVQGVANYGLRPTVENAQEPLLEVHMLEGDTPWDCGDTLTVTWHRFVRPEQKFASVEALREQIGRDIASAW